MFARLALTVLAAVSAATALVVPEGLEVVNLGKRATNPPTYSTCVNSGQIALTFDDGPYIWNADLRNTFAGSKGTLFVNGNNYGCIYDYADTIKAAHAAGWTIGSHGWSHAHMGQLTWDQIHNELWLVEQALTKIIGVKPIYFRPPYGETSQTLYDALANRGYKKVFLWDNDSGDSAGASVASQKAVYDQIANTYPQPHIVLNHETYDGSVHQTIPYAVPLLKSKGYQLVSVDTCLGSQGEWPYTWVGNPQTRDSTWVCQPPLRN